MSDVACTNTTVFNFERFVVQAVFPMPAKSYRKKKVESKSGSRVIYKR